MNDFFEGIVILAMVIALGVGFIFLLNSAFNKMEINECQTWQKMATEYPDFYLTYWQAEQCLAHNVKVDAPVVNAPR